jgi:hypothetical protein
MGLPAVSFSNRGDLGTAAGALEAARTLQALYCARSLYA